MSNPFDTPKPPNPEKVANAQSAANVETAVAQANLNNVNQVTPEGSLTYSQIGTNADGTPKYQATQTYSPQQQAIYNQNSQNSLQAGQIAGNQLGRVNDVLSTPFQLGQTPQQAGVNLNNNLGLNTNLALNQNLGNRTDLGLNTQLGNQTNLNYSNAPSLDDSAVSDRINQLGAARLDPRFAREQQTLESDLANRGVVPGTEAYKRAMDQFGQTKNDAYNQLALEGQNQAFQEQATRRGTSTSETNNMFNAYNQNNQANQQFANDATKSNFDAYNTNNAQNQNFANQNNLAQAGFNNQAQLAQGQFNNQATTQMTNFNNQAQSNNWNQQIQDQLLMRNQPINETTALMSGSQVSQPSYVNTPQTGIANTDVAGLYQNNYNAQISAQNAMMGGLGSIGGGLASTVTWSDKRMKKDIRKVGKLDDGINLYTFKYKDKTGLGGLSHLGVMAQEIEEKIPDAVVDTDSGYKAVDYARVLEEVA
jgi:hypothetical protein